MIDLKMENQSRDVEMTTSEEDDEPVKFGDDAVAEESYCWVLVAPLLVTCGWKRPLNMGKTRPSHFLRNGAIIIRNILT